MTYSSRRMRKMNIECTVIQVLPLVTTMKNSTNLVFQLPQWVRQGKRQNTLSNVKQCISTAAQVCVCARQRELDGTKVKEKTK